MTAQTGGPTSILLSFPAVGTDGSLPPAARGYLVKQSRRPIDTTRAFQRAQTLCDGSCNFPTVSIGTTLTLIISDLRRLTTYYYAVAARDNVSCLLGPRSSTVQATTGVVQTHGSVLLPPQVSNCKY